MMPRELDLDRRETGLFHPTYRLRGRRDSDPTQYGDKLGWAEEGSNRAECTSKLSHDKGATAPDGAPEGAMEATRGLEVNARTSRAAHQTTPNSAGPPGKFQNRNRLHQCNRNDHNSRQWLAAASGAH
jgi:hypothetical protein